MEAEANMSGISGNGNAAVMPTVTVASLKIEVCPGATRIVHHTKIVIGVFAIDPIVVAKRGRTVSTQVNRSVHEGVHVKIIFSDIIVVLISVKFHVVYVCTVVRLRVGLVAVEAEANMSGRSRNGNAAVMPTRKITSMWVNVMPITLGEVLDLKVVPGWFAIKSVIVAKINSGVAAKANWNSSVHESVHVVVIISILIWIDVAPDTMISPVGVMELSSPVVKAVKKIRVANSPNCSREITLKIFSENCCLNRLLSSHRAPATPRSTVSPVVGVIPVVKTAGSIPVADSPVSSGEITLKIFSEHCYICAY